MRLLPLLPVLVPALPGALAQWTSTRVDFKSASSCQTKLGSGSTQPTPLPVSTTTKTVVGGRTTAPTITDTAVFRVDASPAVTVTDYTSTFYTWTIKTVTSGTYTSWSQVNSVIATAVIPQTVCTNNVKPKTVTVYKGTYQPSPGQTTNPPATYPTALACTEETTAFSTLYPITTTRVTSTVTPTVTVRSPTTTITSAVEIAGPVTEWQTTVTSTTTSFTVDNRLQPTSVSCAPTTTLTLAAQCAPTNLVGNLYDSGILIDLPNYAANTVVTYGPRPDQPYQNDPSLCCQMCLDLPGCGASMMGGPGEPFCGLFYIASPSGPQCGKDIFTFREKQDVLPGAGLIVQSGCDKVNIAF